MTAKQPQQTPAQQQAMTAAQRQRAHRLRRQRAVTDAIGAEAHASRVTLLALLNRDLAALEDDTSKMHQVVRNSATRVLRTLVTRYGINLADDS